MTLPATHADVERALGRLEGRFDSLDTRIGEITTSLTAQISAHDARTKAAHEALRQDFVVAITEARKRTEIVAEEANDNMREIGSRVVALEDTELREAGAKEVKNSFWKNLKTILPLIFGGGGLISIVVLLTDKVIK